MLAHLCKKFMPDEDSSGGSAADFGSLWGVSIPSFYFCLLYFCAYLFSFCCFMFYVSYFHCLFSYVLLCLISFCVGIASLVLYYFISAGTPPMFVLFVLSF